jgi:hypothetical protein
VTTASEITLAIHPGGVSHDLVPRFKISSLLAKESNETPTEDDIKEILHAWRSKL